MRYGLLRKRLIISVVFLSVLLIFFEAIDGGAVAGETDPKDEVAGLLEKHTISRFYDPVEFRGEMLEGLLGKKLSHLRLYSFGDGSFKRWKRVVSSPPFSGVGA